MGLCYAARYGYGYALLFLLLLSFPILFLCLCFCACAKTSIHLHPFFYSKSGFQCARAWVGGVEMESFFYYIAMAFLGIWNLSSLVQQHEFRQDIANWPRIVFLGLCAVGILNFLVYYGFLAQ